jgi:hypothetical protein
MFPPEFLKQGIVRELDQHNELITSFAPNSIPAALFIRSGFAKKVTLRIIREMTYSKRDSNQTAESRFQAYFHRILSNSLLIIRTKVEVK